MNAVVDSAQSVLAQLQARLGAAVITDPAELAYFGTDVYSAGQPLLAVLRPGSTEQLAAAVAELTAAGVAVVPRGSSASFSARQVTPASTTT